MRRVSRRDFNHHLGKHVAAVEAGETVELTRRGRVIARVVPASPEDLEARRDSQPYKRVITILDKGVDTQFDRSKPRWTRDEIYEDER